MVAQSIMFQGTGSNVGKSLIVASLCRHFRNQGYRVAPFKPQNMSNNSSVTHEGGEIGRAQALQALACRIKPSIHMNPVLLKPESNHMSQVIVQGQVHTTVGSKDYLALKRDLIHPVMESYNQLAEDHDIVIVEGAGSPAEINLRENDIANMGFARTADVPVVMIGDINRGGVIAQLVGTQNVLETGDRACVKGFVINKFRGNTGLFDDGFRFIEARTKWTGLGVITWNETANRLPPEDTLSLAESNAKSTAGINVYFLVLDKIANFDDLDPLSLHPEVNVQPLRSGTPIPSDADLVIIPGSKSTRADLAQIKKNGWQHDLIAYYRRGGIVLGVCGGYQILGKAIHDPNGVEGRPGSMDGLGLLDVETTMCPTKQLAHTEAIHVASDQRFQSYEIHMGISRGRDCSRPFAHKISNEQLEPEGATSPDGRVMGTYLHGLFVSDAFRTSFLRSVKQSVGGYDYVHAVDKALDEMARHVSDHLDVERLLALMG